MNKKKMLARAIFITAEEFQHITDRGGSAYILHCLEVMNKVKYLGELAMVCAILHDLIEDTEWTIDMLREDGFTEDVLSIVSLLTRNKNKTYMEYIKSISENHIATQIKLADLSHNMDLTRLKKITERDIIRTHVYHNAVSFLKKEGKK